MEFISKKDWWVVEWCEKQDCFNLETLQRTMENNLHDYFNHRATDGWQIVGLFDDIHEAGKFTRKLRKMRDNR